MRNTTRSTSRWSVLLGLFTALLLGIATPAMASLQNPLTVGAQNGALTLGTPGTASFSITVNRTNSTPTSATLTVTTPSPLPTGVAISYWTAATGGTQLTNPIPLTAAATTVYLRVSTTATTPLFSGTLTVTASAASSTTRTGTSTLAVKNNQTITFNALANKTFGDPDFTVSATATSGLAVSFGATGNCTVAGSTVHLTGAGSCTVTASQTGNSSFNAATPVPQTFSIAPGNQTINFGALPSKTTFDPDFGLSATASSGLPVSFGTTTTTICSVAGTVVHLTGTVGDCSITATQAGSANYLSATPVTQTFAVTVVTGAIELHAITGSTTLPAAGGQALTVWGYNTTNAPVTQPGGPVLSVNQGDVVKIVLYNHLREKTALLIQGQPMLPDTTGALPDGGKLYTFTADKPGTYLYEAGLVPNAQHQVAMGLYGALIVRPAVANHAYADIATTIVDEGAATYYDDEAVLVLSEIDPALTFDPVLQVPVDPATFDMRKFAPKYFLINGKVYPETDAIQSAAGRKVLLRYVNAGAKHHSMAVLGLRQNFVAKDGSLLPTLNHNVVAETLAPGQTGDAIATIPASATTASKFAVYDGSLALQNNGADNAFGGMLTFVATLGTAAAPGPVVTALSLAGSNLSATITASTGKNVAAAEYWFDSGAHMSIAPITAGPTVSLSNLAVTLPTTTGAHVLYVRGQDDSTPTGTWGAPRSVTFAADTTGPITSGLTLSPNPSTATPAPVVLSASGNDSATGNSNIAAAEYRIDTGTALPMSVNVNAPVASLTATIPAATVGGLSVGDHTVSVRSQDAAGNWGAFATITLSKVANGPVTSALSASPSANNGSYGVNSSSAVVRVTATVTSTGSTAAAAEGFIDNTAGAAGTGFPFVAADGQWNSAVETASVDIPLATINALTTGTHTISVRGKDAVGNWGALVTISYLIDRDAPTFTSITLAPNPTLGATGVTMTVVGAADTGGAGVAGGEYWIGTDPGVGAGLPFAGLTPSIPVGTLTPGTYTIGARIRDAAGNWSTVSRTAQVVVVPDLIFSNGFETVTGNNRPWGWSSASTTTSSRLNVTTNPALVEARSLLAQGNNTNYVQYNFGTTAQPATATYDARFYFNPNNNASTGQDILLASSGTSNNSFNSPLFHVRYRRNGTQPQVQIQVGATVNAAWINITNNASNRIEVVWQSGTTLQLYVNGTLAQTLTPVSGSVSAVRLGSVTSGGSSTLMYFDAFASKRTVTPLIGP